MKHLLLPSLLLVIGCSAPTNDDGSATSESAVSVNGVDLGEHWRAVVQCDGAHVDVFDSPGYGYLKQIVVDDANAAQYLRGALEAAAKNDAMSPNMTLSGTIRPSRAGELVLYFLDGFDQSRDFSVQSAVTTNDGIRVEASKSTWDKDEGNGLFRKVTDMKIRFVRNGWREVQCNTDNGMGGGYDSYTYCNPTGNGWNEWEIANWIFRGCRSI